MAPRDGASGDGFTMHCAPPLDQDEADALAYPDMSVLRLGRRAPPRLPAEVFGPEWQSWIAEAAHAAACAPDYVAAPLIAATSALIGNARWAQATPGWSEPPHLWCGAVGDSGGGKSPGADCLMRDVLPEVERWMSGDFPDRLRDWKAAQEIRQAKIEAWESDVRAAERKGNALPLPPAETDESEPQESRLLQSPSRRSRLCLPPPRPKGC